VDSGEKYCLSRSVGVGASTRGGEILRARKTEMWIRKETGNLSTDGRKFIPREQDKYPREKIVVHRLSKYRNKE
jgi:hypothetical protein